MRRLLFATALLLPFLAVGQKPAAGQALNRYGQPIEQVDGRWQPVLKAVARFTDRPDTIPRYDIPYKYKAGKLTEAAYAGGTSRDYTYKTYPSGREVKLAADLPSSAAGPCPYIVFFHGGGWRNGAYTAAARTGAFMATQGIAFIRVGYTLAPDGDIEDALADLRDAMAFIAAHALEWNVDSARVGFMGFSAGGHLSSYMAMTWPGTKALISQSGPHDLRAFFDGYSVKSLDEGGWAGYFRLPGGVKYAPSLDRYSPIRNIPPADRIPPVMLVHGTFDAGVPYTQSVDFAAALREKGARTVVLHPILYGPHSCHNAAVASYEDNMLAMAAFALGHL